MKQINTLNLNEDNIEEYLKVVYDTSHLTSNTDIISKIYTLACNDNYKEYDVIYVNFKSPDTIPFHNSFVAYFKQTEDKSLWKLAHNKAGKLIFIEFESFEGFDLDNR